MSQRFTDTQLVILSAAAAREDRQVEQPAGMADDVFAKAVKQLRRRKLVVAADDALTISDAGLDAIGAVDADGDVDDSSSEPSVGHASAPRQGRKTDLLLDLLRR